MLLAGMLTSTKKRERNAGKITNFKLDVSVMRGNSRIMRKGVQKKNRNQ